MREFVDNAAHAAALATGTKVKIDNYGSARDGISVATLAEVGVRLHEAVRGGKGEPGRRASLRATKRPAACRATSRASASARYTSDSPNHTYEMEADNLKPVGHNGFKVQAQAMTALLFDFATRPDYRAVVKREFDGIRALFGEYIAALEQTYKTPVVPEPK